MTILVPRLAGTLLLLALLAGPITAAAQDDAAIDVVGSGVVAPLFQALADASEIDSVNVDVTGTNAGFAAFCQGDADVTLASRPISAEEEALCGQNEVAFLEFLLGYDVLAFVTNPDADLPACVTIDHLAAALAPSASGQIANWNQISPDFPDLALSAILPGIETPTFALADAAIEGAGLRGDATTVASGADIAAAVADAPGALGVMRLAEARIATDSVRVFDVDFGGGTGCQPPAGESVDDRVYDAADELFAYVSAASLEKPGMRGLLEAVVSAENAPAVEAAGFTAPTEAAYTSSQEVLAEERTGRQTAPESTDFEFPPDLFGAITLGGSPAISDYVQTLTTGFTGRYPTVTIDSQFLGVPAGVNRLCADGLDIVAGEPTGEALAACDEAGIAVERLSLGSQAAVLLANAGSDALACLTTDQVATLFRAESAETVTMWNQVDESLPEEEIFLFTPETGAAVTDLVLVATTGVSTAPRTDVAQAHVDPLYRAAAVGNVAGGITVLTWPQYQQVVANDQAGVQVVAVDAGDGCVAPTLRTMGDGSYALSRPVTLLVRARALARPDVQALLWTMLSDGNYALLVDNNIVGLDFGALPDLRASLQVLFDQAEAEAAIAAETTPEPPAAEGTPEAEATEAAE